MSNVYCKDFYIAKVKLYASEGTCLYKNYHLFLDYVLLGYQYIIE